MGIMDKAERTKAAGEGVARGCFNIIVKSTSDFSVRFRFLHRQSF